MKHPKPEPILESYLDQKYDEIRDEQILQSRPKEKKNQADRPKAN